MHAIRVRLRPATVHRRLRVGRARTDSHAASPVASGTGNIASAGALVAPYAGQGPDHPDHVAGHQTARLGDAVRRRAAAYRTGQLSVGRGQRRRDVKRHQVRAQAQHTDFDQSHAEEPLVSRECPFIHYTHEYIITIIIQTQAANHG